MPLTKRQKKILGQISELVETLRAEDAIKHSVRSRLMERRRTKDEVERMREDILQSRAKGVSAVALAEKYGVTVPYIYIVSKK